MACLSALILAANLGAAELSPKVLRLIGPDTLTVRGTDVELFQNSALSEIFRVPLDWDAATGVRQVIGIENRTADGSRWLAVLVGASAIPAGEAEDGTAFQALDANTAVHGDPQSVQEASLRWKADEPPGEIAAKVRRLALSYDNWFLMVKPLDKPLMEFLGGPGAPALKYRNEAIQAIEEASGGIRFGALNEFHAEALLKAPEDAAAVATLARWVPGFVQLQEPWSVPSRLADIAGDLSIRAEGRSVSISFTLPEREMRELLKTPGRLPAE
jgi:hypothetical protein